MKELCFGLLLCLTLDVIDLQRDVDAMKGTLISMSKMETQAALFDENARQWDHLIYLAIQHLEADFEQVCR